MLEKASAWDPCTCKEFLEDVAVKQVPYGGNSVYNTLLCWKQSLVNRCICCKFNWGKKGLKVNPEGTNWGFVNDAGRSQEEEI